jgi:hypothetical protein
MFLLADVTMVAGHAPWTGVPRPRAGSTGDIASERGAYVGSFSNVMLPALRAGYLVVPPHLCDEFIAEREALELFSLRSISSSWPRSSATDTSPATCGEWGRVSRTARCVARRPGTALRWTAGRSTMPAAGLHAATLLPRGWRKSDRSVLTSLQPLSGRRHTPAPALLVRRGTARHTSTTLIEFPVSMRVGLAMGRGCASAAGGSRTSRARHA